MSINLIKKRYFFMLFILLTSLFHSLLHEKKEAQISEYLDSTTTATELKYMSIYNHKKEIADLIFISDINRPQVIELFKNRERKELHKYLLDVYGGYRDFSVRQLHFHLPNNDSFLRMHRPLKFGDNLSQVRPTVKYVNETKKSIDGFEEGKIFNGFRFVYPLFDNFEHIGSVEVSFSGLAFIERFMNTYQIKSNLYIDKSIVNEKVFKSEQTNYVKSPLPHYYFQKSIIEKLGVSATQNIFSMEDQKDIEINIKKAEAFSFHNKSLNKVITFIPLKNPIDSNVAATLCFCISNEVIQEIENNNLIIFFTSISVLILILILLYRELKYKYQLKCDVESRTKELSVLNVKLKNLAEIDALTGIHNRRYLYKISEKLISLSRREKNVISVALLDIDDFKNINDTYGHDVGDTVLKNIAKNIKALIRDSDVFVRFGGEEFVLLFPNTPLKSALSTLENIRKIVSSTSILKDENISISIGVTEFSVDMDVSIKRADTAMYKAKKEGKNRVCVYEES